MRKPHYRLIALLVCMPMMASCAGLIPGFAHPQAAKTLAKAGAPIRLDTPKQAAEPCLLYRLPPKATISDLEIGYATRGAQIVECDGRRQLAVDTSAIEHRLQDEQQALRAKRARPWFLRWLP